MAKKKKKKAEEQPESNQVTEQPTTNETPVTETPEVQETTVQEQPTTEPPEPTVQEQTVMETPEPTTPEAPKEKKKLSGSDFVMKHLIANPDATVEQIKEELSKANLKLADTTIESWPPFMAKIFSYQEELGWKRPNKEADSAATEPAQEGNGSEA